MQRRSGEKTSHIETIITKGIKFSPLQAGSRIGLVLRFASYSYGGLRLKLKREEREELHHVMGACKCTVFPLGTVLSRL